MKTKHTQGEWSTNFTAGFIFDKVSGSRIAEFETETITDHIEDQQERRANAQLIAAAPKMLKALEDIQGIEAFITDTKMKELFQKKVYPAIQKATGQDTK